VVDHYRRAGVLAVVPGLRAVTDVAAEVLQAATEVRVVEVAGDGAAAP
jgi:hypothetical protein